MSLQLLQSDHLACHNMSAIVKQNLSSSFDIHESFASLDENNSTQIRAKEGPSMVFRLHISYTF